MGIIKFSFQKEKVSEKFMIARKFFLEPGVLKASCHGFRIGSRDDYYFDIDNLLNDPIKCSIILSIYLQKINGILKKDRIDLIAFIDKASGGSVGAIRLASSISINTGIPNIIVRPGKEINFEKIKIPFSKRPNAIDGIKKGLQKRKVLVVTDHCTSGIEVLNVAEDISENNGNVAYAITYTLREDKFHFSDFKEKGIEVDVAYVLKEKQLKSEADLDNNLDMYEEKFVSNYKCA
ncbi:MAG: hypothetical protein KKD44_03965 [Proteobacteria bacterium]|nr:hypothetical protein [Pseudomonadota bacterium]